MHALKTDDVTVVLGAPSGWDQSRYGECRGLPVVRHDGVFYSYWAVDWKERLRILFGRPVRLCLVCNAHPPVLLDTEKH